MNLDRKINFAGRWVENEGYGAFTYNFFDQLTKQGVDTAPIQLEAFRSWDLRHFIAAGYDINRPLLLLHPPDNEYVTKLPGRTWVFTMYESTALPKPWVENINKFCERLIVPTKFCADVFEDNGVKKPIHIVPGGIDPTMPIYTKQVDRPFTFMCLADRGSRKGFDLVWKAFWDVFGENPDVRLILKMRQEPEGVVRYLDEAGGDPRVSLFKVDVKNPQDLYVNADCFVFPTRGEGYGLPPRESAACGVPTICTQWGATEDCNEWAIPIGYKLSKSLLPAGGMWAEPDYGALMDAMRMVYEDRDNVKKKALDYALWLRQSATWEIGAKKLIELMEEHLEWH